MAFKTAFIGKSKHFVIDAGGITNTENGNTPVHQFLANPVYSHIALCANHHLIFPVKGLVNGFYQCGSLTGSGGPWTIATSLACITLFTASSCVLFNQGKRVKPKLKVSAFWLP